MGTIHLRFPEHMQIDASLPASIHVLGLDGIAGPCRVKRAGQVISVTRNRDESGHVYLAWPTVDWGELVLVTGTLPEVDREFSVAVELARGTVNRLRNQISTWEEGGLEIPETIRQSAELASRLLAAAIMQSDSQAADLSAIRSIEVAVRSMFELGEVFSAQILPLRLQNRTVAGCWLGVQTRSQSQFAEAARSFAVVHSGDAALADQHRMTPVVFGPLVDMAPGGFDEEVQALDRFETREAAILASARTRLGQVELANLKLIHAVAGLNGTGHRQIGYSQQLQTTLNVLQVCEDCGGNVPVMISFDNPWGERLARSVGGTHPLQIADTLLRRGVRISVLGLEINLDYAHRGSFSRDPLQWLELLDVWAQLGLPLVLLLRAPFGVPADHPQVRIAMADSQRLKYLGTVLKLVLARPVVQGILWEQWSDEGGDAGFPGAGLRQIDGQLKPVWKLFEDLKQLSETAS